MASKKPLPAARKPLPTTKKPSQEITAGSVGADIAKQKYDILLADMQRRAQLGQFDPTTSPGKRNPGKEIILSFEGGQYGAVNDEAADRIAKKYNLDIVKRPEKNSVIPTYLFSVKGDVGSNLAGIGKESGVRYVQGNYRQFTPETKPDPMIEWEDSRMRAALAGEPLPPQQTLTTTQQGQIPTFTETSSSQGQGQASGIGVRQPIMPTPGQMAQQPIPIQMPIMQQGQQPPTFGKANQQAMQNYQNLLEQGLANYQAQTYSGQGQFGSMARPAQTSPQRKPSTPGFPTPKFFG